MEDLTDKDVVEKLRSENYEQFKQLVRMHLSFELDLNTDEFDLPSHEVIYYEKGKLKKWNRLTKKIKSCTSSKTGSGSPMEGEFIQLTLDLIQQLRQLKDFLLKEENLKQEGIFRRAGAVSRQNELRNLINQQKNFIINENYTVHDCATVYKSFLADLPEPLLTDAHYPAHCQIADLCNGVESKVREGKQLGYCNKENHLLNSMQLLVLLLPYENRILLEDIINMLNETSKYHIFNKMSPDTLATLFSPHLICPRNIPPEALHYVSQRMSSVISYMVVKGNVIFDIPSKLATDIRAYFHEIKRKKTMSPEHTLDESISDVSTVNTVYTFVDREKTAAEHNSNPTDTALAQLYAHIQSLPESSKKRKLIKQFNKENGQGTPLQMLMVNRIKNNDLPRSGGKSFSEAIKKHIFHKGLISRTPKRLNSSNHTSNNPSTPNGAVKTPRSRILFPSQIMPNTNFQSSRQQQISNSLSNRVTSTCNLENTITKNRNIENVSMMQHHPLQKSISASSILSSTSMSSDSTNSLNINNSIIFSKKKISAPISRYCSNEFDNNEKKSNISNDTLNEINNQIIGTNYSERNGETILWLNKKNLIDDNDYNSDDSIEENPTNSSLDKYLTPIRSYNKMNKLKKINNKLKSKYKSEPNLFKLTQKDEELEQKQEYNFNSIRAKTEQEIINDGTFMDYIPKTIKNSLIKAVSLGSLIGNFSSTSNICARSEKSKFTKRSISDKTIYYNKNLSSNKFNEETIDSFKDCLSTIQSESELDQDPEPLMNYDTDITDYIMPSYKYINSDFDIKNKNYGKVQVEEESLNEGNGSQLTSNENIVGSYQNLNIYRNIDLITSTPSQFFRRRSMSPITKSTQRMPKAMQESIMTPRSRKPVMLMATTTGSTSHDQSQNVVQSDVSNDNINGIESPYISEYNLSSHESKSTMPNTKKFLHHSIIAATQHIYPAQESPLVQTNYFVNCGEMEPKSIAEAANIKNREALQEPVLKSNKLNSSRTLSNTFREYLLSRSILTGSPVDSSFSSQPEFGSPPDIQDLNESQMSSSLLYCLDGNKPLINNRINKSNNDVFEINYNELGIEVSNCDNKTKLIGESENRNNDSNCSIQRTKEVFLNNQQRKRNCNTLIGNNNDNILTYPDDIFNTRKLLIIEENPNETSL